MNVDYQVEMHVGAMIFRWPSLDRKEVADRVRRNIQTGNAWLWPEPIQLELFACPA